MKIPSAAVLLLAAALHAVPSTAFQVTLPSKTQAAVVLASKSSSRRRASESDGGNDTLEIASTASKIGTFLELEEPSTIAAPSANKKQKSLTERMMAKAPSEGQ